MKEAAAILKEKRRKRGAIDFDFPESKIVLDKDGWPTDIHPYERNVATDIIEDFMLLANETVAKTISGRNCRLYTGPMRNRIRRKSLGWTHLSATLAST